MQPPTPHPNHVRVKLGFKVHILRFVYTVAWGRQLCFARWDILGHRIDQGMVGIRGLDGGHIDVQHILMPTRLKNNIREMPSDRYSPHSCGVSANNKPQLTNFTGSTTRHLLVSYWESISELICPVGRLCKNHSF